MRIRHVLPAVAAVAALLAPAAAQAATKTVSAGTPPKGALTGVPPTTVDNAFYPAKVKVHVGDSVSYKFLGFHDVFFPPKGKPAPAFAVIDPSAPVTGAKDAGGADMWFNGQPSASFNPLVAAPTGSKVINGKGNHGSGLPTGREVQLQGPLLQDRHVHLLLRDPPGDEGHRAGGQEVLEGAVEGRRHQDEQEAGVRGVQARQAARQRGARRPATSSTSATTRRASPRSPSSRRRRRSGPASR